MPRRRRWGNAEGGGEGDDHEEKEMGPKKRMEEIQVTPLTLTCWRGEMKEEGSSTHCRNEQRTEHGNLIPVSPAS